MIIYAVIKPYKNRTEFSGGFFMNEKEAHETARGLNSRYGLTRINYTVMKITVK